jgi:hypothetical protein
VIVSLKRHARKDAPGDRCACGLVLLLKRLQRRRRKHDDVRTLVLGALLRDRPRCGLEVDLASVHLCGLFPTLPEE